MFPGKCQHIQMYNCPDTSRDQAIALTASIVQQTTMYHSMRLVDLDTLPIAAFPISGEVGINILLVVILGLLFILGNDPRSSLHLLLLEVLHLCISQGLQPIGRTRELANLVCNLTSSDQADHDTGANDEGKDEAIGGIPLWSPSTNCRTRIRKVQEVEGEELRDESIFHRQKHRRPSDGRRSHTDRISSVTMISTVACPLETPMNSAEK